MPSKARLKSQVPLPASVGGASKTFIEGLFMKYNSANSLTVSEGAAFIPGSAEVLELAAPITLSGLTLTASTMYHLYLYNNVGTPAVEVVTVAPVRYAGTAFTKTGDSTRRYIGSVLTITAANTLAPFTHSAGRVSYHAWSASPTFQLVSGAVIVAQTVSCLPVVPLTATHLSTFLLNNATDTEARIGNPDYGAVSTTYHSMVIVRGTSYTADVPLNGAQAFAWRHDGAANGLFQVRSYGYLFDR